VLTLFYGHFFLCDIFFSIKRCGIRLSADLTALYLLLIDNLINDEGSNVKNYPPAQKLSIFI